MSIFTEIEAKADELWEDLEGSKVAKIVDNAYNAVVAELKTIGTQQLEAVAETTGEAVLGALPQGPEAAIAAGVAAAVAGFKSAEKTVSAATVNVLASSIVTQVQAQAAA